MVDTTPRRIYDCFIFFNELELLEIRLHELEPCVDRFVLVEAPITHSGWPKPLWYAENASQFRKFHHKITHVVVDDMPDVSPDDREYFQRAAVRRGLGDCRWDDIVLVSDLDEIPSRTAVAGLCTTLKLPSRLIMKYYYYYVNCRVTFDTKGTLATPFGDLGDPTWMRKPGRGMPVVESAGWHFSYLGGPDRVRDKIKAGCHTFLDTPRFTDDEWLASCIDGLHDLFDREQSYRWVEIDHTYPEHLLKNLDRFAHLTHQPA